MLCKEEENSEGSVLERVSQKVEYLVNLLRTSSEGIVTDKILKEILALHTVLQDNKECIESQEYHKMHIDAECRKRVKESRDYTDIRSKRNAEVVAEDAEEVKFCLITQKEIEEKVEAPCGHVFDKEGLAFLYKNTPQKKKFQCPYVGCKSDWHALKYNPTKTK
ncbi:uncharacterized protein NEMAJ01_2344 [Nematocida major]|uniref:uncharacterized protein n=1 Tax=Nematocida major TaxID=1912982 RepID=UPI0020082AB4|nr:uncharacterized protein NEMAJ01_2344 [Nematocida major]KAH9387448.1 hypothetical protein NEMAJ01_2344 [Nematocida major]